MKANLLAYLLHRIKCLFSPAVNITEPKTEMIINRDVEVRMRDGAIIKINIYRPDDNAVHPVIMNFHPYGKDKLPKRGILGYRPPIQYRILDQTGIVHFSSLTSWEAPDPDFWVSHGYTVINGDMRGVFKSKTEASGNFEPFSDQEGNDYYDLIEWAGTQSWSNGKVGLCGVSYLAISQYRPPALQPPHLAAICAWEGVSDLYKDWARPGGIREDGFFKSWTSIVAPQLREHQMAHVTRDQWWQSKVPDLKNIIVPALICGSFSDHSLHTGGSFRAFTEISSKHKWLYTHRTGKWAAFYSPEAKALQLKFFDYFLKGIQNDFTNTLPIRLEVREERDKIHRISMEKEWPLSNTKWTPLYLDAHNMGLTSQLATGVNQAEFAVKKGKLQFSYTIPADMEITGPMKLKLYVSVKETNDVNIFAAVRKFRGNQEVYFEGSYGYKYDVVTKGFLKASLRELDETSSTPWFPKPTFKEQKFLSAGEIVCLEIPLLPSATFFRKGDVLRLDIQGNWIFKLNILMSQASKYEKLIDGSCSVYTGKKYDSHLLIPLQSV